VYCGAPGAGKSTNLAWLHREAKGLHRGELLTAPVGRDRMLWFDFEPLQPTEFRDFHIRFLVMTATGRTVSGMTHKQVMRGADGVVFVADSTPDHLYDTLKSHRETVQQLDAHQLEAGAVPVVLQYNKRDVPHALQRSELDEAINPRKHDVFLTVATLGDGVLETFHDLLKRTLASIAPQNESLPLLKGMSIEAWSDALLQQLYGRTSFSKPLPAQKAEQREPSEDSRPVPVLAMPANAPTVVTDIASEPSVTRKLSLVDFEKALAHSKAKTTEAAAAAAALPAPAPSPPPAPQPGPPPAPAPAAPTSPEALHVGLRAALDAADAIAGGAELDVAMKDVLDVATRIAGAAFASLLLPGADGGVRVAGSLAPGGDPVARSGGAGKLVGKLAGKGSVASIHDPITNPALAEALRGCDVRRVLSAPVRSPRGLHGVLLVYQGAGAAPPTAELLGGLGAMAKALSLAIRYR